MSLVEKIRKARETKVDVGGYTFTVRRPTPVDMYRLNGRAVDAEVLMPFVIGWGGVAELDILPGGDPHPLAFDAQVCAEWLADRPDLLIPLSTAIMDAYHAYAATLNDAKKK
jgi:hypothetical protein